MEEHKGHNIKIHSWLIIRIIIVITFTVIMVCGIQFCVHANAKELMTWLISKPQYVCLTVLFIGGIYYALTGLFCLGVSTVIIGIVCWGWGIINYLKFTMRQEYVIGDDVISFFKGELTFAKEDVTFSKHLLYFAVPFIVMVVIAILGDLFLGRKRNFRVKWYGRSIQLFVGILICVISGVTVYATESIYDYMSDEERLEHKYGLVLAFIPDNTLPHLVTNADYTSMLSSTYVRKGCTKKEDISGAVEKQSDQDVKPNIIIIMSESLYDTDNFDNVKADQDPMAVMHQYQKQYGGGSIAVDIFGGGTANTEFEFLTGIGHKYYAGNLMYNGMINNGQMSMVGYMNQLGYETVAIHPYKGSFFNRKNTYKNFGFDQMYFQENMKYTDDLFDVNISDYSLTKEIIDKYENTRKEGDKPYFNFSVSVGSHKPCLDYKKGIPYQYVKRVSILPKTGNFSSTASRDARRYYSAVYDANQAFKQLTDYFENVDEPTVILLFGDHAPPLTDEGYCEMTTKALSDEQLYQTPLVTWNNYDLPKMELHNINANYLSAAFLSYLHFPLPKACVYNQNIMKYWYQCNTKKCVKRVDGTSIQNFNNEEMVTEKASLALYQNELSMQKDLLDLWDVPKEIKSK